MSKIPLISRKKNSLALRIMSALVMLPIAIFIIFTGGILYAVFVGLLAGLILYEWNGITTKKALNPVFIVEVIFVFMMVYSLYQGTFFPQYSYIIALILMVGVGLFYKINLGFALLGVLYAAVPALSLLWLREISEQGGWIVLWMMIIVWSMDTGAYFSGKTIGGPKLCPKISPNKTWSGLIGGAVMATLIASITAYYCDLETILVAIKPTVGLASGPTWFIHEVMSTNSLFLVLVGVSAMLAIWSQIGDLAESALKRHFNVKDSGAIIPGHGGIMDRVDGIVFAAPAVVLLIYTAWAMDGVM